MAVIEAVKDLLKALQGEPVSPKVEPAKNKLIEELAAYERQVGEEEDEDAP